MPKYLPKTSVPSVKYKYKLYAKNPTIATISIVFIISIPPSSGVTDFRIDWATLSARSLIDAGLADWPGVTALIIDGNLLFSILIHFINIKLFR